MPETLWLPFLLVGLVAPADERRHRSGPEALWAESWYFDFAAADGSLGGYVRMALRPRQKVAWYWAALVGRGRRLVLVKDHDLEPPRGRDLEIRGQGIWAAINCETPLDHWSLGLEAFAVAYDDPTEAWRSERGDLVGLGYDLEWEATEPPSPLTDSGGAGYRQRCRVTGEILVGDERIDFDGPGWRDHRWGVQDWWSPDAEPVAVQAPDPGVVVAAAPLLLDGTAGRRSRLMRALVATGSGYEWVEWLDRRPEAT